MGWFLTPSDGKRAAARPMVRVGGLAVVAMTMLVSSAAMAEPARDRHHDDNDAARFDVIVSGRIASDCRLSGGGDIDFGELTGGEQVTADLALACNLPFDLSFQSERGGLAHVTKPRGEGPFAGTLGYTLNVAVPTLSPLAGMMSGAFSSADLTSRKTLTSGEAIAAGGGRLQIRTQVPQGAGLLAGEYYEVLVVTLQPKV